ncbi:Smad nuclear interacting protein-like [Thraustotheca clavata]|uniref:Smad nuclear interacting protein-like n=1 Tax=Thraustotheca clavata TaxID=74557 RepID=A0A1W0A6Z1_9STRA|nr:Smad nuclear interacting protein-like [Thraustotheca clavata]
MDERKRRSRSRSRDRPLRDERRRSRRREDRPRRQTKARDFTHLLDGSEEKFKWGQPEKEEEKEPVEVQKPNFGLSGALAKDSATGNTRNGVVMKWCEPPEARVPDKRWRLYVFKNGENIATLHLHRQSACLFGRDKKVADAFLEHESISKQHAVLQFRLRVKEERASELDQPEMVHEIIPYIMDLKSTNHTFLNGNKIEHSRYIELREQDVLTFGESTREYVLMKTSK